MGIEQNPNRTRTHILTQTNRIERSQNVWQAEPEPNRTVSLVEPNTTRTLCSGFDSHLYVVHQVWFSTLLSCSKICINYMYTALFLKKIKMRSVFRRVLHSKCLAYITAKPTVCEARVHWPNGRVLAIRSKTSGRPGTIMPCIKRSQRYSPGFPVGTMEEGYVAYVRQSTHNSII